MIAGNVGKLFAGLELFEDSHDDDGMLEVGVLTATGALATARTMARVAVTTVDDGPYARTTKARKIRVRFDREVLYQVDGGDREKVRTLKIRVSRAGWSCACRPPAAAVRSMAWSPARRAGRRRPGAAPPDGDARRAPLDRR